MERYFFQGWKLGKSGNNSQGIARRRLSFDDRDARFVAAMAHHGVSKVEIARAIGIDLKTLDKHFSEVLATAAARRRADEIIALVARAKAGSAPALLKVEAAIRRGSAESP